MAPPPAFIVLRIMLPLTLPLIDWYLFCSWESLRISACCAVVPWDRQPSKSVLFWLVFVPPRAARPFFILLVCLLLFL